MFCPEDGVEIPMTGSDAVFAYYDPCPECGTTWVHNGELGQYGQGGGVNIVDDDYDFTADDAEPEDDVPCLSCDDTGIVSGTDRECACGQPRF